MNRLYKCIRLLLATLLLFMSVPAHANDTYFSGFGTASLSCFSNDTADYVINDQPEGAGRTRSCDAGIDSLLGVQFDLALSESVDFGLQIIADRNADRSYTPDISVAQLRWHPTDALTIRLGRVPTPVFLHSENRQVRYAMPWVRPPLEVYGLVPTFSLDGLDIIYQGSLGSWNTEWYGGIHQLNLDSPRPNSRETDPLEASGAFLTLALLDHHTRIKLGYNYSEIDFTTSDVEVLFTGLRLSGIPGGAQLADDLDINKSPVHIVTIGVQHERNDWIAMAEFGYRSMEGFFRDQYGAYATLGKRFGPWMPYTTLARRWTRGPDTDSRVAGADPLQQGVEVLLASSRFDTSSISMGLSREITEQAIVKFQADWIKPDSDSWGLYTNHSADYNFANPDSDWLFTLSMDFVF